MPEIASISLSDLLIDTQNPRLEQPNTGQREALRAFAADQKGKLVALAKDVVAYGLNPSELPIVMPFHDDLKRYVVLEGNRRLTVLKALENPEWLVGAMQHTEVEEMRRLSKEYQEDPIESVQCVVVQTRDEAQHWMLIRHAPQNHGGVSISSWTSDDSSRFRSRSGKIDFHTQALNLLEESGQLTQSKRETPSSIKLQALAWHSGGTSKTWYWLPGGDSHCSWREEASYQGTDVCCERFGVWAKKSKGHICEGRAHKVCKRIARPYCCPFVVLRWRNFGVVIGKSSCVGSATGGIAVGSS